MASNATLRLPTTYNGLLDDVMARYSKKYRSRQFFNRMLAKNVFFGGGIYINDGYLLNHVSAREYLLNENSLLRVMLRFGFIRVLTRFSDPKGLAELPERMAQQKNQSFQSLLASPEWKDFKTTWYKLADSLYGGKVRTRMWPNRNMSYGFTKIILRALDAPPREVGLKGVPEEIWRDVRRSFLARKPRWSGPRDKYEKAAKKVLDNHGISDRLRHRMLSSIMNLANQAYHYNFGFGLTHEDRSGVAVDTTIGMAFDEFLQLTESVNPRVLKKIRLFGVPSQVAFDDGEVFQDFVKRGSDIWQAKRRYLAALVSAVDTDSVDPVELSTRITSASDDYAKAIARELPFSLKNRDFRGTDKDKIVYVAPGQTSPLKPLTPDAIGAQHGVLAIGIKKAAHQKGIEFLSQRGVLSDAPAIRLNEIVPQLTSLAFDKGRAKEFLSDIPPMR